MGQPQQELPFLRLLMAPMTATMTRPVTAMIAIIDAVFIGLVQLNNLTMQQPRLLGIGRLLRRLPSGHRVRGGRC